MTIIEQIKAEIERRLKKYATDVTMPLEALGKVILELKGILSFISTLEESERPEPYNPVYDEAYLNEKIKKATESWKGVDVDAMLAECRGYDEEKSEKPMQKELEEEISRYLREECSDDDEPGIHEIARHFAKWRAEHLDTSGKTISVKSGDEITINGHKIIYDKDKGYVTIVKSEELVPNVPNQAAVNWICSHKNGEVLYVKDAFIAGAKWQAEQLLKSSPLPEDTVLFNKGVEEGRRLAEEEQADLFTIVALDAAQRAKEQMMKEAVEGEVIKDWDNNLSIKSGTISGFKFGDKVRVIVLPKED